MFINEWSAHGQSDSNLGHKGQAVADTRTKSDSNLGRKGQAVADTRINRLTRWLTDSVQTTFCEENMANSRDYCNPNYTEKIKLQHFF